MTIAVRLFIKFGRKSDRRIEPKLNSVEFADDGTQIDPFMPWKTYAGMTDDEIAAIWGYLRSVPAKPFGNK